MNRHIKKIKSIFIYEKKYTDMLLNKIISLKDKDYIVIYNPECIGIMNSTFELFDINKCISIKEMFNKKQIVNISDAIIATNVKRVIFNTIAYGYKELAERIYSKNPEIKISFLWHGSHSLFANFNEQKFLEDILEMQKRGIINSVGYFKKSMADYYIKKGYKSYHLMNTVNMHKNIADKKEDKTNKECIKIGLYSSGDRWEKNTYNQLSACAMVKNAKVDIIPQTNLSLSFCKLMNIDIVNSNLEKSIKRQDLIKRMSKNDINLYVTFTECSPMVPLESFEMGTICLLGNNTDYFENSELKNLIVVNQEDSIDEIYNKIIFCLDKGKKILQLYSEWKKTHDKLVKQKLDEFIGG